MKDIFSVVFSPGEWAGAIATLLTAITSLVVSIVSLKSTKTNKEKISEVHDKVEENNAE
jgi:mannitol-specific phosphotransferase system IIBC component